MHLRTYLATTRRILTQLRADRRTVGLIAIVPAALLTLLYFVYRDYPGASALFDHVAVTMMAVLPMAVMFLVTSVAMLRERSGGTLERLLAMPMGKVDFLGGYAVAFGAVAALQAVDELANRALLIAGERKIGDEVEAVVQGRHTNSPWY